MPSQIRQIVTIYCLCDDFLHAWGHEDAPQTKMTTTVASLKCPKSQETHIFADARSLDQHEEALLAAGGRHRVSARRKNGKQLLPAWMNYTAKHERKRVETVFSQIASASGWSIHAVTARDFEGKVFLTVRVFTIAAIL